MTTGNDIPELIESERAFERFLDAVEPLDRIAVDTEGNSMHAYKERLCLIQVGSADRTWLLDPLGDVDLGPFFDRLEDPATTKVFHDAEFDVLQLGRSYDVRLAGLFDTKVAAVALGEPTVGLAAGVERYFGVALDKAQQRSDWAKRPLTDKQIRYAGLDVRYLVALSERLEGRIAAAAPVVRLEFESECRRLEAMDVRPAPRDPLAWFHVKGVSRLRGIELTLARELWRWRERAAERADDPPFRVFGNALLVELARVAPRTSAELSRCPHLPGRFVSRYGKEVLDVIAAGLELDPLARPKTDDRHRKDKLVREDDRDVYDRLKRWRKDVAGMRPTDPSLVLNREVMEALAAYRPRPDSLESLRDTDLLEPWRVEQYGVAIVAAIVG